MWLVISNATDGKYCRGRWLRAAFNSCDVHNRANSPFLKQACRHNFTYTHGYRAPRTLYFFQDDPHSVVFLNTSCRLNLKRHLRFTSCVGTLVRRAKCITSLSHLDSLRPYKIVLWSFQRFTSESPSCVSTSKMPALVFSPLSSCFVPLQLPSSKWCVQTFIISALNNREP